MPDEAEYVRNSLEAVNTRLEGEGRRLINPNDPKMQERYGLTPQKPSSGRPEPGKQLLPYL